MKNTIIFVLALSGCGYEQPDYTLFDVQVFFNEGVGPEEGYLRHATEYYFDKLSEYSGEDRNTIKDMGWLHISHSIFPRTSPPFSWMDSHPGRFRPETSTPNL